MYIPINHLCIYVLVYSSISLSLFSFRLSVLSIYLSIPISSTVSHPLDLPSVCPSITLSVPSFSPSLPLPSSPPSWK